MLHDATIRYHEEAYDDVFALLIMSSVSMNDFVLLWRLLLSNMILFEVCNGRQKGVILEHPFQIFFFLFFFIGFVTLHFKFKIIHLITAKFHLY